MEKLVIERFNGLPPIVLEKTGEHTYKVISEEWNTWTEHFQKVMERGQAGNAAPC